MSVEVDEKIEKIFKVDYGDILFQRSSETREDAGTANIYLDKNNFALFGGFVIRGRKISEYVPEFMNYFLKSSEIRHRIFMISQGAQHINIGQNDLSELKIKIPCEEEQKKIAEYFSSLDRIIDAENKMLEHLRLMKKGLLQKLFL